MNVAISLRLATEDWEQGSAYVVEAERLGAHSVWTPEAWGHDAAAEVRVGSDDVRQHLVGAPLLGLRPLAEARGRHGAGRRREIGHRGLDLGDDLAWRLLGALGLEIAAEACLLVGHGREGSTPHVYPISHS